MQQFTAIEYWPDTESEVRFIPADTLPSLPMTAAGIYVFDEDGVLLIKNGRGWDIPGGHIEPGETPEEAVARELFEEAAASVENIQLAGYLTIKKLKKNERNKTYPSEGCIIVYKGKGLNLYDYSPQFETTGRMISPIDQLQLYHHNWTEMKRQIIGYVKDL